MVLITHLDDCSPTTQANALAKAVIVHYCIYPASSCLLWPTSVSLHYPTLAGTVL
jgi:hypothetical protein